MRPILIFTLFLGIVLFIVQHFQLPLSVHPDKWSILAFFLAVSLFQQYLIERGMANRRKYFVQMYLGSLVLRFLLSMAFFGTFLYVGVVRPTEFLITFFVLYLLYTFFEIFVINRKLRRDLKP